MVTSLKALILLCSLLQIAGVFLIILAGITKIKCLWAIISITGFAAIVKAFLPHHPGDNSKLGYEIPISLAAAICGFVLILLSIIMASL